MADRKIRFTTIREAFMIRRYHTIPHVAIPDTVGHHTCNVLNTLFFLYDEQPPTEVVRAALHHDVTEVLTGDIPAPAKWANVALAKVLDEAERAGVDQLGLQPPLTGLDAELLRYADIMDVGFKALEELSSGNEVFQILLENALKVIVKQLAGPLSQHARSHELFQILLDNRFIRVEEFLPPTPTGGQDVRH